MISNILNDALSNGFVPICLVQNQALFSALLVVPFILVSMDPYR